MLLTADNFQLTDPAVATAVAQGDSITLQNQITQLVAAGAQAIDINTGPLNRRGDEQMVFCVKAAAAATNRPLLIDTVNAPAIRAALTIGVANRIIINGFSLEPSKLEQILPLAVEFNVEIIGYLLDEHSRVPTSLDEKLEIAMTLYQTALSAGLRPEQLIIDPVVAPLSWQDAARHNRALLDVLQLLPEMLGHAVKTAAGLSNLTTGTGAPRHKEMLEQAFIPMLASRGLYILLANMHHRQSVDMVHLSRWLLDEGVFAWYQVETLDDRT